MKSPTQNSLNLLRKSGYSAAVVEHWNPFAHIRQDLFGWIDIVAASPNEILGVQTTTKPNMRARITKARGNAALMRWMMAGGHLVVHGWYKKGRLWQVEAYDLHMEDVR